MARSLAAVLVLVAVVVFSAAGAPGQTPKRGGTLVTGRPSFTEPACLNPLTCTPGVGLALIQVLEGAFESGPDLVPRPNLVSDVTRGRNPPTLTYHIRPEARWSDGVRVTASDFVFTDRVRRSTSPDPEDWHRLYVRDVRALDARTVRVELRARFAAWRNLFDIVLPRHALAGEDVTKVWRDRVDNPKTGRLIGSGPFLLSRLERGKQITLVRNPRYWGPHLAYLDGLVMRFMAEDPGDPLSPLRKGEVDLSLTLGRGTAAVSADEAREIRKLPGWRAAAWPGTAMEHFMFRVRPGGHPALRSKLVRQALAFGIDRVAIAREIQEDAPTASRRPLDSTVFLPVEPYYQPTWRRYRYEPAKARRLLEQAGCSRGSDGIYECAGEPLRLRFVTNTGDPVRERVLALAAAQLRQVGVEVDPQYAPLPTYFGKILPGGDFDAALYSWSGVFGGVFVWPEALCGHISNWGGYCSRLVTRDARQNLIGDLAARARVLNHLDAKLADAVPVLPVVQPMVRMFYRSNVRGIVPGGGGPYEQLESSEDWWLADQR